MILFFVYLVGAFCWFSWALGFMTYDAWLVTAAFVILGVNSIVSAIKSIVEWVGGKIPA